MFMGEYSHSIDEKGRLIVPSKFREELSGRFVVTKGLEKCLYAYPMEEWEKIEEKFKELPLTAKDARKFTRFFFSGAGELEIDKQGRALIPANLREYAGIEKDVVLAGVISRVEIWSRQNWEENSADTDMDEIAGHIMELGLNI